MVNPQQPEMRRSGRGQTTQEGVEANSPRSKVGKGTAKSLGKGRGHPHGTDRMNKGGGKGGGVPPDQRPPHPA
ncbi:hypothetical protein [Bailinhaonella thermotolerans]|uniref:Uncharacterized protein n=1 Tax=Bailinhaonella thermotolerans TaxID=1070861 RepID=A0A3A4A4L6_9ACTN|nr:hypothetical protein [Bailinhaonella thermotolerans]RJL22731.1 hypothetical protein D5H75_34630 [Bailinhaonella thermotolerans]